MVTKRFSVLLLFLLLPISSMAAPQLFISLNKTDIQLGHVIDAELYGIDLQGRLVDIDLHDLKEVFGVTLEETADDVADPRWPDRSVQMLRLKLYPRQIGNLILPELSLEGAQSTPHTILVTPGIKKTRTGIMDIRRALTISSTQPWERQQVLVEVDVITQDTFASLSAKTLRIPGFEVFPIPPSVDKNTGNDAGQSVMRLGWVLSPLAAGQYHIDVPPVEYRESGLTERTYYFPKQTLNVKALPPYIPPTMPVGLIRIASRLNSSSLVFPNRLHYWDVTLTGNGVSPNWIPPLSRQIQSNNELQFFPASTERLSFADRDGLHSQVTYHIPFKPISNGRLNLPDLRIQYFDPESGRLDYASHRPQFALVMNTSLRILFGVLLFLMLCGAGIYLYRKIGLLRQRHRLRKTVVSDIRQARSFIELRMALKPLAQAEGWPNNMTLQHFAQHCRTSRNMPDDVIALIDQLSQACYSNKANIDLNEYRAALLDRLGSAFAWR